MAANDFDDARMMYETTSRRASHRNREGEEDGENETSIEQLFPDLPFPDQSYFNLNSTSTTPTPTDDDDVYRTNREVAVQAVSHDSLASFTAAASASAAANTQSVTSSSTTGAVPPFPLPPPSAAATAAAAAVVAAAATSSSGLDSSAGSLILDGNTLHVANMGPAGTSSPGSVVPTANTVPEFLYQLTKMLTDNNRDIIEWSKGKIEVHSPHKLETHVLNRYFRHSKFASFQRQLNYFGFRKLAGKGKMAPCSYVNDDTSDELASLLQVKRKPGGEGNPNRGGKKREREDGKPNANGGGGTAKTNSDAETSTTTTVNPVLAGILHQSSNGGMSAALSTSARVGQVSGSAPRAAHPSQIDIARVAVGRGIRHGLTKSQIHPTSRNTAQSSISTGARSTNGSEVVAPSPVQASLNALTNNFRNSLQDLQQAAVGGRSQASAPAQHETVSINTSRGYIPGSLRRDDSLVDLAMIPLVDEYGGGDGNPSSAGNSIGFDFVDFPFDTGFFNDDP